MPFLGNTPANTFVSIAKQTITGNGGTTYSLSYAVVTANDIDVFYNNVRQEPGVAYTANGTTITFTEAIQSTDSVYILFNGQAVGTIDAPAGAYLPTTGGTVNGQLSVNNKIQIQQDAGSNNRLILRGTTGSSYRWNVDNFGSTNRFRIFRENDSDATLGMIAAEFDSSGRLSLPQQPRSFARSTNNTSNVTTNSNEKISSNFNVNLGTTGFYDTSNGRWTAPVTGWYVFGCSLMLNPPSTNSNRVVTRVNGSDYLGPTNSGDALQPSFNMGTGTQANITYSHLWYANAGDYLEVFARSGTNVGPVYYGHSWAYCYFLG